MRKIVHLFETVHLRIKKKKMKSCGVFILACLVCFALAEKNNNTKTKVVKRNKCAIPPSAPKKIEEVINVCQDEIKLAILSEALEALNIEDHAKGRVKRAAFNPEEKRIAGCLLQCVYRKMNAVNERGFPTVEGLVALYSEGVEQKEYILATLQAVNKCLTTAQRRHIIAPQSLDENGKTCDIAYDVFDCVSVEIERYCGQKP